MPILVQWKWIEKTKSFLVIFHFYDDYSKPNLRLKKRKLVGFDPHTRQFLNYPIDEKRDRPLPIEAARPIMTWAPSHREMALLSDLLHYSNIIGGLSEDARRDLRYDLEITVVEKDLEKDEFAIDEKRLADLDRRFPNPCVFLGFDRNKEGIYGAFFCIELCPAYIDYLREVLKPYL